MTPMNSFTSWSFNKFSFRSLLLYLVPLIAISIFFWNPDFDRNLFDPSDNTPGSKPDVWEVGALAIPSLSKLAPELFRDREGEGFEFELLPAVFENPVLFWKAIKFDYEFNPLHQSIQVENPTLETIKAFKESFSKSYGFDCEFHLEIPKQICIEKFSQTHAIPIKLYLDQIPNNINEDNPPKAEGLLDDAVKLLGFEINDGDDELEIASWFRKRTANIKEKLNTENSKEELDNEIIGIFEKIEKYIENKELKDKSTMDETEAPQIASLIIQSVEDNDETIIQIGSLLVVKQLSGDTSTIDVYVLSDDEMWFLETHSDLFKQPKIILEELEKSNINQAILTGFLLFSMTA